MENAVIVVELDLPEISLVFHHGAIPATVKNLVHLRSTIPADATWTCAGMGRAQLSMAGFAILMGGHVRVGLEENICLRKGDLATNVQLVERVCRLASIVERPIAVPDGARCLLKLPARQND